MASSQEDVNSMFQHLTIEVGISKVSEPFAQIDLKCMFLDPTVNIESLYFVPSNLIIPKCGII